MSATFEHPNGPTAGVAESWRERLRPFHPGDVAGTRTDAGAFLSTVAALHRRVRQTKRRRRYGGLIAGTLPLADPLRAVLDSARAVAARGTPTRASCGVPRSRQFLRSCRLTIRHGIDVETIYRYRMFSAPNPASTPRWVQMSDAMLLYRITSLLDGREAADTLADKRRFAEWCATRGLPSVPVLMEFDRGAVTRSQLAGGELPAVELFAKWGARYGGGSTIAWVPGGGRWTDTAGRSWTGEEIVRHLADRSRGGPVLLQPRLRNHPAIVPLSPNALSTVRVMTIRGPNEEPRFLGAVMRMGIGNHTADNFGKGGIASAVDAEHGFLGPACSLDEHFHLRHHVTHPDSGAQIEGVTIPRWPDVVALAVDAHRLLGGLACIGWDVALLADGSIALIEGNWNPGVKVVQAATQVPLLDTAYASCFAAWLAGPAADLDDDWLTDHYHWRPAEGR